MIRKKDIRRALRGRKRQVCHSLFAVQLGEWWYTKRGGFWTRSYCQAKKWTRRTEAQKVARRTAAELVEIIQGE